MFGKLKIILNDKTLESQESENYKDEDEDEDYENKNEYECDYYDYENQNKTIDQNKIKGLNNILDEIIDKSKSFEEQIESLKKLEDLKGYWPYIDFGDKKLNSKYFKIQLADMSNEIDKKLFE